MSIVSQYNFAPTPLSKSNLLREGRNPDNIYVTGNTVIDAMQHTVRQDYHHPERESGRSVSMVKATKCSSQEES